MSTKKRPNPAKEEADGAAHGAIAIAARNAKVWKWLEQNSQELICALSSETRYDAELGNYGEVDRYTRLTREFAQMMGLQTEQSQTPARALGAHA